MEHRPTQPSPFPILAGSSRDPDMHRAGPGQTAGCVGVERTGGRGEVWEHMSDVLQTISIQSVLPPQTGAWRRCRTSLQGDLERPDQDRADLLRQSASRLDSNQFTLVAG